MAFTDFEKTAQAIIEGQKDIPGAPWSLRLQQLLRAKAIMEENEAKFEERRLADIQFPTVDEVRDRVLRDRKNPAPPVDIYKDVCDWWEANNSSLAWSGGLQGVAWDDLWPQAKEEIAYIYNSIQKHKPCQP